MIRIILLLFVASLLASCSEDDSSRNTIEYFETHLQADMSHSELMFVFGRPDKDLGSGIHIYVFTLDDATEVRVGITDKILYATHLDQDGNVLKVLI